MITPFFCMAYHLQYAQQVAKADVKQTSTMRNHNYD